MNKIGAIVLAAGKSTRLKSRLPKVLHPVCGRPLVYFPVKEICQIGAAPVAVVISEDFKGKFEEIFKDNKKVSFAIQKEILGTADAVKSARDELLGKCEYTLIVPGDVPLVKSETLKEFANETLSREATCGLLTMEFKDPANYGRIVRNHGGLVEAVVEAKDASPAELLIREINSGIYCIKTDWLFDTINKISPENKQKEYYLTDIIKIAVGQEKRIAAKCIRESSELMGVNTRYELAEAGRIMRHRVLEGLMNNGAGIVDEFHTYIDDGVEIGTDTIIEPHAFIEGKTRIGSDCYIENGVVIRNSVIADGVRIKAYSVIEESKIENGATIGPFARLRPGSTIESDVKIGNFVEVKKSLFKKGSKANHLSYIGDATVGERTNVGCGTITCNYDGAAKHKTTIGSDCFIGSDVQFVAPVEIGNGSTIAAGSTITENVPENSLAIAREHQVIKQNWKKNT
jgi:bifunctional UDP-N-acetylglucosamine pyrophosphorylase/glucosamine-1-phosphate N-acetyltransferase